MNLKQKILAGFMLLIALLIAAGAVSTIEFMKLSRSVSALIDDNYKTIEATQTMVDALEREDSGILLVILDEVDSGRDIIHRADSAFMAAFAIAKNNITEEGEDLYVARIDSLYNIYKNHWRKPIQNLHNQEEVLVYQRDMHQSFLDVKLAVTELMTLNQRSMFDEASILKDKSHRALMPGIVAIIGGLVFALLLSFFISRYFVSPIHDLIEAVKTFNPRDRSLRTHLKTNDEIKTLENEINGLIQKLNRLNENK